MTEKKLKHLTVALPLNLSRDFKTICCAMDKSHRDIVMFLINNFVHENHYKLKEMMDKKDEK